MTAISYHETVKDLQDLDWPEGDPFARREWFELLEQAGHAAIYPTIRSDAATLTLPLATDGQTWRSLTNWYAFTWAAAGDIALLPPLAEALRSRAHAIEFGKLPEQTALAMTSAFRMAGWYANLSPCDINHVLRVEGRDYDAFLSQRPGLLRTTLTRKSGKLQTRISTQFSSDDWALYEAVYAASWKPQEGDPALLRRLAENESAAGRYRLGIAEHDGTPVAAQFWTVDCGTAYIHKLAHREAAKSLSPGTVLSAAMFRQSIDVDRVSMIDFGTGDDAYKRDWMEEARIRWSVTCLDPAKWRNWPRIAKLRLRELVSRPAAG